MDTVSLIFVAVIVASAFGYALWPLFQVSGASPGVSSPDGQEDRTQEEIARLFLEREQAYKNIMEVDLDRDMGKLSDEDYADLIGQARTEALEILRRLETRGVKEGVVPAHVSVKEAAETAVRATRSKFAHAGSQASSGSDPASSFSSASGRALDDRLEKEILQYRKVETPADQGNMESEGGPLNRFCTSCGAEVATGHNFCPACGEKTQ